MTVTGCALLVFVLGGCGSSGSHSSASVTTTTSAASAESSASAPPHTATVLVVSAARTKLGTLDQRYTCRGSDVVPTIAWKLPEGAAATTKEQLVFVRTITEKAIITNWAVAGLRPTVHSIGAGKLPAGAVVARNTFGQVGYHLCPPVGAVVTMGVYALQHAVALKEGFNPGID